MKTLVQLARIAFLAFGVALVSSCGGDNGSDEPVHPPSISNLVYSPATAYQVSGGTVAITGSVSFMDAGGDVASLRLVTSNGEDLTVPTPTANGMMSGTATGTFLVSVDKVGQYTFEIWLVDSGGRTSSHLGGTFEIVPAQPTATISSLRYSPTRALFMPSATVLIDVAVDVAAAGNWTTSYLRMVTSAGWDVSIPISALIDPATRTVAGTFNVPAYEVGVYTFEVWLTDGRDGYSNRLSGTFEVIPITEAAIDTWRAWMTISAGTIAMSYTSTGTVGGVRATASGTLVTSWGLMPATFESQPAYRRFAEFSGTMTVAGQPTSYRNTVFSYLDANHLPLGEQSSTYGVVSGVPTIPNTGKIGDSGTLYNTAHYADSTKATLVGTSTTTYSLSAETPSTALMTITTTYKTPAGADVSSDAFAYRVTLDGSAKLLYEVKTEGTDALTSTFVSLW